MTSLTQLKSLPFILIIVVIILSALLITAKLSSNSIYWCKSPDKLLPFLNQLDNKTYSMMQMFILRLNDNNYACGYVIKDNNSYNVVYNINNYLVVGDFVDMNTKSIKGYEQIQKVIKQHE